MAAPFVHRIRVRYAECDPQDVVFNANYLAYIDHTITELWRAALGGYHVMLERGVDVVVAETNLRFLASARFDDELDLEVTVAHLGTTSLTTTHRHRRARDGALLVDAWIRHVWVDRATMTKTPIPNWARAAFAPWHIPAPVKTPS